MSGVRPRSPATVRVALVGCGRISRNHLDAIAKVDGARARRRRGHRSRARAQAVGAELGVPAFGSLEEMLAEVPMRPRCDLHAVGTAPAARHRRGEGRAARAHREADGDLARGGRRARAGVRRGRRPPLRREAEPAQSADPAAQARGRQGALRADLHGEHHGALDAPAGVLRRGAVARHVGVRRRRVHEPGDRTTST